MKASCSQFGVPNNSDSEISDLKSAIQEVASSTGIDSRFILAIIMQESNGCVRAPTTVYSIANPGLMQSHEGSGSCNSGSSVQNPCPKSQMVQMITDGTAGTATGDGLQQCLAKSGASDVSKYYKAARIYNSGSLDASGNLGQGVATHCYATDVANRLTGWFSGTTSCDQATIGSLDGGAPSSGDSTVSSVVASASLVISSAVSSGISSVVSVATSATSAASIEVQPFYTWVNPSATSTASIDAQSPSTRATPSATIEATSTTSAASIEVQSFYSWAESSATIKAGGIFAQSSASSASIAEQTSASVVSVPIPTATTLKTYTQIVTSISSSPTIPIVTASPTSSIAISYPSASSESSSNTTYTPGTACSTPGTWNCINGNSFQKCSSGIWSTVDSLATGTECTAGETHDIDIYATDGGHKRRAFARGLKHGHLHVLERFARES